MLNLLADSLKWYKKWGGKPVFPWIAAAQAYRLRDFSRAERLYEKGLLKNKRHSAYVNALLDLSFCKYKLRKVKEAESLLKEAVSLQPLLLEGWLRLGKLLLWVGKPNSAYKILKDILPKFPESEELWGITLYSGTLIKADDALSLLEIRPVRGNSPVPPVALSLADIVFGDKHSGRVFLTKLCSSDNPPIEALHAISEVLLSEENYGMAKHFLRRALYSSPENPTTLSLLSEVYLEERSGYEYAVQLAQQACQVSGWQSPIFMNQLVRSHLAVGDRVSALLIASRALEISDEEFNEREDLSKLVTELRAQSLS